MEETNEILLQLRALIKSEDQFGCTKEIVLGCWCVNEWRCCRNRKVQCVHTSAVALYSAAFDRFFCVIHQGKTKHFPACCAWEGQEQQTCQIKSWLIPVRCFWPGAGACVSSIFLLILEHGTAACLVAFNFSMWHSLPSSVGRMTPIFIPSHSSPYQGLPCLRDSEEH